MKKTLYFIALCTLTFSTSAMTVFLQENLGVNGTLRYCRYSDGKVYTFDAIDMCALSIEASGFGGMGTLLEEKNTGGMNKLCIYDVMGEKKAIRVGLSNLCPISRQF